MVRSGSVVALDPDSGKVIRVEGVTGAQMFHQDLSTIMACGHGTGDEALVAYGPEVTACPWFAGSIPNGRSQG